MSVLIWFKASPHKETLFALFLSPGAVQGYIIKLVIVLSYSLGRCRGIVTKSTTHHLYLLGRETAPGSRRQTSQPQNPAPISADSAAAGNTPTAHCVKFTPASGCSRSIQGPHQAIILHGGMTQELGRQKLAAGGFDGVTGRPVVSAGLIMQTGQTERRQRPPTCVRE